MIKGLRHVGIVVDDLQLVASFYMELLGFTLLNEQEEPFDVMESLGIKDASLYTAKFGIPGGGVVELLHYDPPELQKSIGLSGTGTMHISFTVERLDDMCKMLLRNGVRFTGPPCVSEHTKVAFCLDPEGNLLELVEMLH